MPRLTHSPADLSGFHGSKYHLHDNGSRMRTLPRPSSSTPGYCFDSLGCPVGSPHSPHPNPAPDCSPHRFRSWFPPFSKRHISFFLVVQARNRTSHPRPLPFFKEPNPSLNSVGSTSRISRLHPLLQLLTLPPAPAHAPWSLVCTITGPPSWFHTTTAPRLFST